MAIIMNFDTQIKGDSNIEGHEDWISCDTVQAGVGRGISMSGGGKDRDVSSPSFAEVTISKSTDVASPDLWYQATQGMSLGKAQIDFVQTGADGTTQVYLTWTLHDAIVSSYSQSSSGDRPDETIALNFTKIEFEYKQFSGSEITGEAKKGWDVMAAKAV